MFRHTFIVTWMNNITDVHSAVEKDLFWGNTWNALAKEPSRRFFSHKMKEPSSLGSAKIGMVHFTCWYIRGWQVKLCDPLTIRAISEHFCGELPSWRGTISSILYLKKCSCEIKLNFRANLGLMQLLVTSCWHHPRICITNFWLLKQHLQATNDKNNMHCTLCIFKIKK